MQNMYGTVRSFIYRRKTKGATNPEVSKKESFQNQVPQQHACKWDGTDTLRFAIMGDTQIGSKYTQLTYLHQFYDLCEKEGIKDG